MVGRSVNALSFHDSSLRLFPARECQENVKPFGARARWVWSITVEMYNKARYGSLCPMNESFALSHA